MRALVAAQALAGVRGEVLSDAAGAARFLEPRCRRLRFAGEDSHRPLVLRKAVGVRVFRFAPGENRVPAEAMSPRSAVVRSGQTRRQCSTIRRTCLSATAAASTSDGRSGAHSGCSRQKKSAACRGKRRSRCGRTCREPARLAACPSCRDTSQAARPDPFRIGPSSNSQSSGRPCFCTLVVALGQRQRKFQRVWPSSMISPSVGSCREAESQTGCKTRRDELRMANPFPLFCKTCARSSAG